MSDAPHPWPLGTATGLGPFPGTDPLEAARVVFGELGQLPCLPLLVDRGLGADPVGRTAAVLVDLHVDFVPGGWRLVPRPGRDEQRARQYLADDLDALEEAAGNYEGPLKVQLLGPWSLAANLELSRGEKALIDGGAVRDLASSLREGIARHVAVVRQRVAGAGRVVVQMDEPLLGAVLRGEISTASGWGRLRAVDEQVMEDVLHGIVTGVDGDVGVRANAPGTPLRIIRRAGARFFAADAGVLRVLPEDDLGDLLEGGSGLLAGIIPLDEARFVSPLSALEPVRRLWTRLGFSLDFLPRAVVVTPVEGLEHIHPGVAKGVLRRSVETGQFLEKVRAQESW